MRSILLKRIERNDFGTPHCRVSTSVMEERQGKYRVNMFDMKDVGLENDNATIEYGRRSEYNVGTLAV